MNSGVRSTSSDANNVRQEVFPFGQWTITTRKGIILQSQCTCDNTRRTKQFPPETTPEKHFVQIQSDPNLCHICKHHMSLPFLNNMPDMLFKDNLLRLQHYTGVAIEFNPLDALKQIKETKDPLRVAVAGGWQSARSDFPFAKSIAKPYDWTLTTDYRGTLISSIRKKPLLGAKGNTMKTTSDELSISCTSEPQELTDPGHKKEDSSAFKERDDEAHRLCLEVKETSERIDVNKLKVREEILFYDDITLYEDELADHGTAQYSVKVRVMPKSLFILARYYLRIDNVLVRINDTRIYYELNKDYLLREYTNRESKISSLPSLPISTLVNPNELMNHLPLVESSYERLNLPKSVGVR